MTLRLAPFDADREFVTQAVFRANGIAWGRGFPFDKASVDAGLLKKLYENRRITYADTDRGRELLGRFQSQAPLVPEAVKVKRRSDARPDAQEPVPPSEPDAESPEIVAERLAKRLNHASLVQKAKGLAGVRKSMTKLQIATALVKAGRAD